MKEGWVRTCMGGFCEVIAGQSPDGRFYNSEGRGIPFYQGKKDFGERFLKAPTYWTTQSTKLARKGDILMSVRAPVGPVNFAAEDVCIGRGLAAIRTNRKLDRDFLFYQLLYLQPEIAGKEGAVFASINKAEIEQLQIAYTPLPEQRRIVGILDNALAGISIAKANSKKNRQNARAVFKSHIESVFASGGTGWVSKRLGDIAEVKGGRRVPKGYKLLVESSGFPYLRVTDFNDSGSIDMGDLRYLSREVYRQIKSYIITSADMYISIAGTIGKTGMVPKELDGANLTENACRLVFRPGISNRFVYYFTQTAYFAEQAGLNTRTAAQPKLALSRLSTIRLGIPDLSLQESLANKFDAIRAETHRLETLYLQKLAAFEVLKQSILQQAFTGQF